MINYILSCMYILFFLFSLYFIGNILFSKVKSFPLRITYIYLIYKFFASLFGCITQLLKLPFQFYFIVLLIFWIALYGYALYKKKKENIVVFDKRRNKEIFKKYWFVLVIAIILIFFSMINIEYHWFGNHLDDGLYVNIVSDYVKGIDTFHIHSANGLNQIAKFGPHSLNAWQLEAAFYVKIFRVVPVVLLAFAQSFINYIIFMLVVLAFLEKVLPKEVIKKYKYQIQFIPAVIILFMFQFDVLNRMIILQDGWQFGNAMFYGSTIIRTMGIFLLLVPFIDKEKLGFKDLVIYGCISFILLAQSSVALPVVIMVGVAYFVSHLYFDRNCRFILALVLLLLIICGIVLPNIGLINDHALNLYRANSRSIILYGSIIVFLLGYLYKNKTINKINTTILFIIAFMYIPEINDIVENLSMYDFVEARFWTGTFYAIAILAFAYAFVFACKLLSKKKLLVLKGVLLFLLVLGVTLSFEFKYKNIFKSIEILRYNNKLLPNSTVNLGKELERLHIKTKDHLYVLSPDWVVTNGYNHSLAVLLRQHTPSSSIISAIPRYGYFSNKEFKGYEQADNDNYNAFMYDQSGQSYLRVKKILEKYPINCLVVTSKLADWITKDSGFELKKSVCDVDICYYIYYRK